METLGPFQICGPSQCPVVSPALSAAPPLSHRGSHLAHCEPNTELGQHHGLHLQGESSPLGKEDKHTHSSAAQVPFPGLGLPSVKPLHSLFSEALGFCAIPGLGSRHQEWQMGPLGSLGGPWVPLLCPILAERVPLGGRKLVQSAKGEESGVPCLSPCLSFSICTSGMIMK